MKPNYNRAQLISVICRISNRKAALEDAWAPLTKAVKNHDFPAWVESWTVFDLLVEATARDIGDPMQGTQHGSWLAWFLFDNLSGERQMPAKASKWKRPRRICSAEDLADLIIADL